MKVHVKVVQPNTHKHSGLMVFLKTACTVYSLWPINAKSSKWKVKCTRIMFALHYIIEIIGLVGLINGINCCFTSTSEIVKSFAEIIFIVEVLFNLAYHLLHAPQLESLTIEMYNFFNVSKPQDLREPRLMYWMLPGIYIIASSLFFVAPYFTRTQITPLNTAYPMIPIETRWGLAVSITLNAMQIGNTIAVVLLDLLILSIIWHAAFQFKLLGRGLKKLSKRKMRWWIIEHQRAIKYARKINFVMAPLAIKSTIAVALYMTLSGLVIIHRVPAIELTKFYTVTVFSMIRYFGCSWAADTMTQEGEDIAWHVYCSPWIDANPKLRRWLLLIMQRCQKPVTIHSTAFLSSWSLRFYGQVIYTVLSFFSALKVALHV